MHGAEIYEKAKERYDYNPLTGGLIYIEDTHRNKVGDIAGSNDGLGYLRVTIRINGKQILLKSHRLAFYIMEGYLPEQIDHIDGDRANNKWINLRGCNRFENGQNLGMSSNNTSGYRGVSKYGKHGKWLGSVRVEGKSYTKASFLTPEKANEWVISKSKEVYGEFYNENRLQTTKGEII